MKKQAVFLLLLVSSVATQAQLRKIPADVTEVFKTRYPHAERVSWKDKISSFQATFFLNETEMTANFGSEGDWERTERKIKFEETLWGNLSNTENHVKSNTTQQFFIGYTHMNHHSRGFHRRNTAAYHSDI